MRITKHDVDAQLTILNNQSFGQYAISRYAPGDGWIRHELYTGEPKKIGETENYYLEHEKTMCGYQLTAREVFFALKTVNDILRNEIKLRELD